jgi:hypothetical protein
LHDCFERSDAIGGHDSDVWSVSVYTISVKHGTNHESTLVTDWKSERKSGGVRRTGAGMQTFLCTLGDFRNNFSGVAEIFKAANPTAGGLTYGSIISHRSST